MTNQYYDEDLYRSQFDIMEKYREMAEDELGFDASDDEISARALELRAQEQGDYEPDFDDVDDWDIDAAQQRYEDMLQKRGER